MLTELEYVIGCVREAAQAEIIPRFNQVGFTIKPDGSFVTEADLACNYRLQERLKARYPHIAFLSEEMEAAQQAQLIQDSEWLWSLDPLDGTSNFTAGVPLFCTSLALIRRGQVVQAVTYDPMRDEVFTAELGKGAYLNGQRLQCGVCGLSLKQSIALVDFKRLPPHIRTKLVNHPPYASQRNLGTCALEWAWMAAGRGQLYLHGGMKLWDLAAGSLLLSEAGGVAYTLQGEAVFNASLNIRSVIAASDPSLFKNWQAFMRDLVHE